MKQPEDTKTIDLLQGERRGRGRPRIENPLSPAERAKRYRARQRENKVSRLEDGMSVTKNKGVTENKNSPEMLVPVDELVAEQGRSDVLRAIVDMFIDHRMKKKPLPADIFRNICETVVKL